MSWQDLQWQRLAGDVAHVNQIEKDLLVDAFLFEAPRTRFQVPVYFITGSDDWTTPTRLTRAYSTAITAPDTACYVIDDAGHMPFMDNPEQFQEAVLDALDRR